MNFIRPAVEQPLLPCSPPYQVFPEPSNVVSGTALGAITIAGGVLASGVALVTMPVAGLHLDFHVCTLLIP